MLFSIRTIIAGLANALLGCTCGFDCGAANDRYRRVSLVATRLGERLLTEPVAGTRHGRRELVLLPEAVRKRHTAWLERNKIIRATLLVNI